jgi:hypothetical protein
MGVSSGCTPSTTPVKVSVGQSGTPSTNAYSSRYAITKAGEFVVFDSLDALVSSDTNSKRDVLVAITGF